MNRIKDKIDEIEKYLFELEDIVPDKIKDYKNDNVIRAACERYFEKIVESVTDLSFIIILTKKLNIPQDDINAFSILKENEIIDDNLYNKLKQAKGMRNILAHQYGVVDDNVVFQALKNELDGDILAFLKVVKRL